jgi:hypothetical protein
MELTKLLECSPKLPMDQWYMGAVQIMLSMPKMNTSSLAYLFEYVVHTCMHIHLNESYIGYAETTYPLTFIT